MIHNGDCLSLGGCFIFHPSQICPLCDIIDSQLFPSCKFLLDPTLGNGRDGLWLVSNMLIYQNEMLSYLKSLAHSAKCADSGLSEHSVGLPDLLSVKAVAGFSQVEETLAFVLR